VRIGGRVNVIPNGTALVLTGGGARAAYQVGVLAAIAERTQGNGFPILTGASAGAINAAYLAAHSGDLSQAVQGLRAHWSQLTADIIYGSRTPTFMRLLARWLEGLALGCRDGAPGVRGVFDSRGLRRVLAEAIDFDRIEQNILLGRLRAIGLTATSYSSGQTVTYVQGGEDVPVWHRSNRLALRSHLTLDHLMASSAIPLIFPAVKLSGEFFGDGSVRQTFPLSPAIRLGAQRILAIGTRSGVATPAPPTVRGQYPLIAQSLGLLLDSIFMDHLDADAEVLASMNQLLGTASAGAAASSTFRHVDFLLFRPSRDLGEIAKECADELPRAVRSLARSFGAEGHGGSEFLSYLLFDPTFTGRLMELGYKDCHRDWAKVERLIAPPLPLPQATVSSSS
jgi:NTE family protein